MKIIDWNGSDLVVEFDSEEERDFYSHQGECYYDCAQGVRHGLIPESRISTEDCKKLLKPLGAWSQEEMDEMDDDDLRIKLLWVLAGCASDDNSLEGHASTY